jgi:acetyl esterase/lipase
MTNATALLFGSLLALACSSETAGDTDDPEQGDPSGLTGPDTPSPQPTLNPAPTSSSTTQPASEVRPMTLPPTSQTQSPVTQPPGPDDTGEPDPQEVPPGTGSVAPSIPAVSGECPAFRTSTITFQGLGGIQLVAGTKAAAATAPMVFYWHGTGSRSGEFATLAGAVRTGVEAEGGILVSFQGTTGGDSLSGTSVFGRGDIDLVDQLVACAVRDHNIDPRRIFTTGCSAGGLFATNLAALRSDYIAAAAPNSGGFTFPQQFQGEYTPALMTVHGAPGRDVVVVDFSNTSATADRAFKARGGFVINCNHGGGHCGGGGLAPDVWEFFASHPYGVEPAPSPWATAGLPDGFSEQCQVFSQQ